MRSVVLLSLLVVALTEVTRPPEDDAERARRLTLSKNITSILDMLVNKSHYDRRLRPNYGGPPVDVGITIYVSSISAVSEVEMDYTLDMYLRQVWNDPRLKFSGPVPDLTIDIEYLKSIWVPDTFFPNEKKSYFHLATTHNSFLRISENGQIYTSQRLTVTATCNMQLQLFPLDSQECTLEIESYGYSTEDIKYTWKDGSKSVKKDEKLRLPQFDITGLDIRQRIAALSTGRYSRLICHFLFTRNIGFYMIQIYLPSILIVIISWVSFWLSRDATPARVALGVTTVLTMTTLMTTTNSAMPKVSYIKSIDYYLGTCFLMVFASLLEYAAVGYLNKRLRMRKERNMRAKSSSAPNNILSAGGSPNPGSRYPLLPVTPDGGAGYRQLQAVAQSPPMLNAQGFQQLECDCDIEKSTIRAIKLTPPKRKKHWGVTPSGIDKYSRIMFPLVLSADGYSIEDTMYHWAKGLPDSVQKFENISLPQFSIDSLNGRNYTQKLSTGLYHRLAVDFVFVRSLGFYMMQIYLPSILIVIISWVSFWLSRDASPARVALGVTTVLTMTTLMTTTNAQLPKVSYVKAIDMYLGVCFVMVFASLLEFATVSYLGKKLRMKRERKAKEAVTPSNPPMEFPMSVPNIIAHPSLMQDSSQTPWLPNVDHFECDCDLPRIIKLPKVKRTRRRFPNVLTPSKIDKWSRLIFPLVFCAYNNGYTESDIVLALKGKDAVGHANITLPTFNSGEVTSQTIQQRLETGNYSRLTIRFPFQRTLGFYFTQIYVPALFVVMISWVSFWISRESAPARTLLGITTVLTITTLITNTSRTLPPVSYIKAVDYYLGVCYFAVILALLEFAAVSYSGKKQKERKDKFKKLNLPDCTCKPRSRFSVRMLWENFLLPNVIDKYARIIFPSVFTTFNVVYWAYFLHRSKRI